jgi:hypothetical protein
MSLADPAEQDWTVFSSRSHRAGQRRVGDREG